MAHDALLMLLGFLIGTFSTWAMMKEELRRATRHGVVRRGSLRRRED